jgi:DNA-binding NarL/FixJ family response regulator
LIFTNGLGGGYTQFFILAIPIFFLIGTKRPIFSAASGIIAYLFTSVMAWAAEIYLPESLRVLGTSLYVSAAVATIVFLVLVSLFFELLRGKALAIELYTLLYDDKGVFDGVHPADVLSVYQSQPTPEQQVTPETQTMINAGLTQDEIKVALMLIEGNMRSEITRKLHLSSDEVGTHINAIRSKISGADESERFAEIVKKYRLTGRETDMLHCLCRNMTNADIAAELFLSEETIKIHVRNLMKKIPVENRSSISVWVETCK